MGNYRKELTPRNWDLRAYGINYFGYYSQKTAKTKIEKAHHESCYEICFLEKGMQPYYVYPSPDSEESEAKLYRLYGGEIFLTHPYELHSTGDFCQQRGRLCWILLDSECPSLLGHTKERSDLLKEALAGMKHHILRPPQSVCARLPEAFQLFYLRDPRVMFRACELLTLFVLELADFNEKATAGSYRYGALSSKVLEAVTLIQNNLFNPELNLDMIASHLNYSRSHMMNTFKKEIGLTVHEFILRNKIDFACDLLQTHSITETALLLNFSSSQHFSKVFREHIGMSPMQYIRSITGAGTLA